MVDTAVDTAQSASKGLPVTLEGVLINMTYNTLMAGEIGSGGKQAVNEAVDETADSIGDSVRREAKSGGNTDFYVTPSVLSVLYIAKSIPLYAPNLG